MAYIGKSPSGTGVRQRYYFTATGGETSLSGTDDNGLTLSYSDGAYVDVLLNGIELVAGTDYNTSTANTIAGLAALAASDVVTVTVYDIFTVADTVSAKNGGTFSGNVVFNGNTTGLDLNGTEMVLDADGDTSITADTDDQIDFKTAGSDRAIINSSGDVGIGTSSPENFVGYTNLEVYNSSSGGVVQFTGGGTESSPTVKGRLVGDSSGVIQLKSVSNHPLVFYTNNTEASRLSEGGMYFQGTTNNSLYASTSDTGITLQGSDQRSSGTGAAIQISSDGSESWANFYVNRTNIASDGRFMQFSSNGSAVGSITGTTSSTAFNTTSDHRLKENDVDMTGAIARVKQLQPKRFNFIADTTDTLVDGFMAHEVQTVVPEAITGTHNQVDGDGNPVYQGIDQSKLVPLLTGALKEAIAKIEALETRVQALEDV